MEAPGLTSNVSESAAPSRGKKRFICCVLAIVPLLIFLQVAFDTTDQWRQLNIWLALPLVAILLVPALLVWRSKSARFINTAFVISVVLVVLSALGSIAFVVGNKPYKRYRLKRLADQSPKIYLAADAKFYPQAITNSKYGVAYDTQSIKEYSLSQIDSENPCAPIATLNCEFKKNTPGGTKVYYAVGDLVQFYVFDIDQTRIFIRPTPDIQLSTKDTVSSYIDNLKPLSLSFIKSEISKIKDP